MLYSVVDDRSGVAYQEYRCVYGEDVEAGLRFLFNAMAPKPDESRLIMQGIPAMPSTWTMGRSPAVGCSRTSWRASVSGRFRICRSGRTAGVLRPDRRARSNARSGR